MMIKEVYAKPCPFCGRSDIRTIRVPSRMWFTVCFPDDGEGCGARVDLQFTSQSSLTRWNKRTTPRSSHD